MIQDQNTAVAHDYDPGTNTSEIIIIVGDADSGTAVNAYIQLRKLGMDVCLLERDPEPEPFVSFELKYMGIPAWPELYGDAPHRAPNHYPPAPPKIQFKSTALGKPKVTIKQPVSKAGFKRGQRR